MPAPAQAGLSAALWRLLTNTARVEERPAAAPASHAPAVERAVALALHADAGPGGEAERASRARQRASAELELLNVQQPETFLQAMLAEHDESFAARRVREETHRYVRRRTELLRRMLTSHLEAPLEYDASEEVLELEVLATDFATSVEEFEEDFPGVARLPEVLAQTALPLPEFARLP